MAAGTRINPYQIHLAAQEGKQTSTLLVLTEGLKLTELRGQQPHSALTPPKSFKSSSRSLLPWGNAGKHLESQPGVLCWALICPRAQQSQDCQRETESSNENPSY